jgi:cell fate regulator YaaT (PSP1 superfamily)
LKKNRKFVKIGSMKKVTKIFGFLQQKTFVVKFDESHENFVENEIVFADFPKAGRNAVRILKVGTRAQNVDLEISLGEILTEKDLEIFQKNKDAAKKDFTTLRNLVEKKELKIWPVFGELSFDGRLFYAGFLSDEKIEFTDLVRDFSHATGRRIFFEKIGNRDRARIFGTLGKCGRKCCCGNFLNPLPTVSMGATRVQNLQNRNMESVAGCCGKLKCCLNFEADFYREKAKKLPKMKKRVQFQNKIGRVVGLDFLAEKVKISFPDGEIVFAPAAEVIFPVKK